MRYPIKYINLIDFFLEKRDQTRGGVEGFHTPFCFNFEEIKKLGLLEIDIKEILEKMKYEVVKVKDEDDEPWERNVLKNYKITNGEVKIFDCTTDQLKQYKKKIINKLKKSVIECDPKCYPKKIKYGNSNWIKLSNAIRREVFFILYKNFPETLEYQNIWQELPHKMRSEYTTPAPENEKKIIQNAVNGLNRRLLKNSFPKNTIMSVPGKGYRLAI